MRIVSWGSSGSLGRQRIFNVNYQLWELAIFWVFSEVSTFLADHQMPCH